MFFSAFLPVYSNYHDHCSVHGTSVPLFHGLFRFSYEEIVVTIRVEHSSLFDQWQRFEEKKTFPVTIVAHSCQ